MFVLAGSSKHDLSVNQKENSHLIGVSYMTMNNEFYEIMSEEINARVEVEGDRIILRDPALDADRQIERIGEMLDSGIEVLVLTPVDKNIRIPAESIVTQDNVEEFGIDRWQ